MAKSTEKLNGLQKTFLLGMVMLMLVLVFMFLQPILGTLLLAAVIVVGVYPLHKILNRKIRLPETISALTTLILVTLLILAPFSYLFVFVIEQATDAYQVVSEKINLLSSVDIQLVPAMIEKSRIGIWFAKVTEYIPISLTQVINGISEIIRFISTSLLSQTTNIVKHVSAFTIQTVIFFFAMYYLLKDGEKLAHYLKNLLPLSQAHRNQVENKLYGLSYSIIYGFFGAAIAQGLMLGIGFYFAGINNPAFWGLIGAILSPIPIVGIALIWIPAVIALFVAKKILLAIFLLAWCMAIVTTMDNLVKPFLIGAKSSLHPFAVLIMILGGGFAFGLQGVLFGPFVLSLAITFLHIYELEYRNVLNGKK